MMTPQESPPTPHTHVTSLSSQMQHEVKMTNNPNTSNIDLFLTGFSTSWSAQNLFGFFKAFYFIVVSYFSATPSDV